LYKERKKLILHSLRILRDVANEYGDRILYGLLPDTVVAGNTVYRKTSIKRYAENVVLYCRELGIEECPIKKEYVEGGKLVIVVNRDAVDKMLSELIRIVGEKKKQKKERRATNIAGEKLEEIRRLNEEIRRLYDENERLRKELAELYTSLKRMKNELSYTRNKKDEETSSLRNRIAELEERLEALQKENRVLKATLGNLKSKLCYTKETVMKAMHVIREYRKLLKSLMELSPSRAVKSLEKYAIYGDFTLADAVITLVMDVVTTVYKNGKSPVDNYVEMYENGEITEKDIEHIREMLKKDIERCEKIISTLKS